MKKYRYLSSKYFDNYSIAIRQWKAKHSHCQLLHGYALSFKVWFASNEPDVDKQLDDMNWIVDFGGFKPQPVGNGLKDWMNHMWDHTTLVEYDDPYRDVFEGLHSFGVAKVHFMNPIGAESAARLVFEKMNDVLSKTNEGRCRVVKVECWEAPQNSAIFEEISE